MSAAGRVHPTGGVTQPHPGTIALLLGLLLSSWDYCSPPGLVKTVQFTVRSEPCITECIQGHRNYHWCHKSQRVCDEDREKCDSDWDYCSVDDQHTRYNYLCEGPCTRQKQGFMTKSYY